MKRSKVQSGDTIVEVMFAIAVAGLVIVLSLAVMNRGVATTQMAVENTLVRQSLDGQAEALRYLRDTNSPQWQEILEDWTSASATPFNDENTSCQPTGGAPFFLQIFEPTDDIPTGSIAVEQYDNNADISQDVFAQPGQGLWIEAVKNSEDNFIDFYIQACWPPPFEGPNARTGTIVRLYE